MGEKQGTISLLGCMSTVCGVRTWVSMIRIFLGIGKTEFSFADWSECYLWLTPMRPWDQSMVFEPLLYNCSSKFWAGRPKSFRKREAICFPTHCHLNILPMPGEIVLRVWPTNPNPKTTTLPCRCLHVRTLFLQDHLRWGGIVRGRLRGRRLFLLMTTAYYLTKFPVYFRSPNILFSSFPIKYPSANASRFSGRLVLNT